MWTPFTQNEKDQDTIHTEEDRQGFYVSLFFFFTQPKSSRVNQVEFEVNPGPRCADLMLWCMKEMEVCGRSLVSPYLLASYPLKDIICEPASSFNAD